MRRIPSLAVHHPWLMVLGWLCLVALVSIGGRIVHPPASNPSFLPAGAESQRAAAVDGAKFTGGHQSAQLVIVDSNGLQASDHVLAGQIGDWLRGRPRSADILAVSPAQPSPDGSALVMQVIFRSTGPAPDGPDSRIARIEQHLAGLRLPPGVSVALTGDLAISHDINAGISGSGSSGRSDLFRAVSVLVVVVVLALVYRAPLAVLVPLSSIGLVLAASAPLLDVAAATVGLPASSNSLPFVFVVILGAGTN